MQTLLAVVPRRHPLRFGAAPMSLMVAAGLLGTACGGRSPTTPTSCAVTISTANGNTVTVGATLELVASLAQTCGGAAVTWTSSAPGIATVSSSGIVTGVAQGQVFIVARAGTGRDSMQVYVLSTLNRNVATIELTPANLTVAAGDTFSVGVVARNLAGEEIAEPTLVWSTGETIPTDPIIIASPLVGVYLWVGDSTADLAYAIRPTPNGMTASLTVRAVSTGVGASMHVTILPSRAAGQLYACSSSSFDVGDVAGVIRINADGSDLNAYPQNPGGDPHALFDVGPSADHTHLLWLAFPLLGGSNELWVADSNGTDARSLGTVLDAAWSPTDPNTLLVVSDQTDPAYPGSAYLTGIDGTRRRRLTGSARYPLFSPLGDNVAFAVGTPGPCCSGQLDIVDTNGANLRVLAIDVVDPDCGLGPSTAWSPDGTRLAYLSGSPTCQEPPILKIVRIADGSTTTLPLPAGIQPDPQSALAWSPDGSQIVFQTSDQFYLVRADGSGSRPLIDVPALEPLYRIEPSWWNSWDVGHGPVWSPDGGMVAVTGVPAVNAPTPVTGKLAFQPLYQSGVYVVTADGSEVSAVTPAGPGNFGCPAWR
jgi:Bacterial Ig-like domain (group 2)/WD40-like Beta Propeller Repeat